MSVMSDLHAFLHIRYVTIGHMAGKTLLPLPPDDVYSSMEKNQHDKDRYAQFYSSAHSLVFSDCCTKEYRRHEKNVSQPAVSKPAQTQP